MDNSGPARNHFHCKLPTDRWTTNRYLIVSSELPEILSDEDFDKLLKARDEAPRSAHERWDNSALRPTRLPSDGLPESCIEQQFPHIATKLTLAWPSDACAQYITNLVVNWREARQGFPQEVINDLLMLHEINDMLINNAGRRSQGTATPSRR
jgi:hypothetical protein